MRKVIGITLALMLLVLFSACAAEESHTVSLGNVNSVDIEQNIEDPVIPGPFFEIEDSLGYDYEKRTLEAAGLQFKSPEGWMHTVINGRTQRFDVPSDDEHMPGYSIIVALTYKNSGEDTVLPFEYEKYFISDMDYMEYYVDGTLYHEEYNELPSEIFSNTDISESTELYSFLVYDDVYAEDRNGISARDDTLSSLHYNVNWNGMPITIRTLVKEEDKENAKTVLNRIISSFSNVQPPSPTLSEAELGDITLTLPSSFSINKSNGKTIYETPSTANDVYAGMKLALFNIDYDTDIDDMSFAKTYGTAIAEAFMPRSAYSSIVSLPSEKTNIVIDGRTVGFKTLNLTYVVSDPESSDAYYGDSGNAFMFLYYLPAETGKAKILALWTLSPQIEAAFDVNTLIIDHTKL